MVIFRLYHLLHTNQTQHVLLACLSRADKYSKHLITHGMILQNLMLHHMHLSLPGSPAQAIPMQEDLVYAHPQISYRGMITTSRRHLSFSHIA